MKKILIIGAGELGSRHLQSCNLLNEAMDITVVDLSQTALQIAKSRFEASIQEVKHKISYTQQLACNSPVDIAIIASTAQSRRLLIEKLLAEAEVKHLVLEKLLFTEEEDYYTIEKSLAGLTTKTWVNCCMRMMPYYQQLKALFHGEALQYQVSGSQYGLVTNAIHYLDHVAYLTGSHEFTLETKNLDATPIPSKRKGYFELTGTLSAGFANGSLASLHCDKAGTLPLQIEIYNQKHRIISREWEQKAWQTSVDKDWLWEEVEAKIPFQSSLTAQLITTLLETDACVLPEYRTSMQMHLQLLKPLRCFLQDKQFSSSMDYPFT